MTHNLLPGERLDELNYKGMRIIQNPSAPCFSIDAVLLSDFVKLNGAGSLLDLGTGTGIIPLLLSGRHEKLQITAVELMPEMADMAERSVKLNHLENRIHVLHEDLRRLPEVFPPCSVPVITSNPPYYKVGAGKISADPLRAAARSESFCTLDDLFFVVFYLLSEDGSFYMIHRAEREKEIKSVSRSHGLYVSCFRYVKPYADKEPNLILLAFSKQQDTAALEQEPLIVYESEHGYSEEMKLIYQGR